MISTIHPNEYQKKLEDLFIQARKDTEKIRRELETFGHIKHHKDLKIITNDGLNYGFECGLIKSKIFIQLEKEEKTENVRK